MIFYVVISLLVSKDFSDISLKFYLICLFVPRYFLSLMYFILISISVILVFSCSIYGVRSCNGAFYNSVDSFNIDILCTCGNEVPLQLRYYNVSVNIYIYFNLLKLVSLVFVSSDGDPLHLRGHNVFTTMYIYSNLLLCVSVMSFRENNG